MAVAEVKLSRKQFEAYRVLSDDVTNFLCYGGGANGGKSWLGCMWLLSMALQYPGTKYFIGREELKRLRDSTLLTFFKVCQFYGIRRDIDFKYNGQDHFISFPDGGSRIDLLDLKFLPSDPLYERYGSTEYTAGWIEEGGEVHVRAFDTLKSRIGRQFNDKYGILRKMLITCNPKKNWVHRIFYKPWREDALAPGHRFIESLVFDNTFREHDAIQAIMQIEEKSTRERLLGNWEYEDEPQQLIHYEWIEQCRKAEYDPGKRVLGVDVAWDGADDTYFALMQGNRLMETRMRHHQSPDVTADETRAIMAEQHIDADHVGVDGVGLGAAVITPLYRAKVNVENIIAGESAPFFEEYKYFEFKNLRALMWWIARDDIEHGRVNMETASDALIEDLTAPRYEIVNDKLVKIESKDDIKARIGRSTDEGDAFIMANYIRHLRRIIVPSGTASLKSAGIF